MKKIMLFIILLNFACFSQRDTVKIVDDYFNNLEEHQDLMKISDINDEQLWKLAKQIYTSYQNHPKAAYERIWSQFRGETTIDYSGIQAFLIREIEKRFGKEYAKILEYPFTFKIIVLKKEAVKDFWPYESYKTVVTAKIEYVFCGEKFQVDDIIEFHCYIGKIGDFEVNKSYIVPLRYTYNEERRLNGLFLEKKAIMYTDGYVLDKDFELTNNKKIEFDKFVNIYDKALDILKGSSK